MVDSNPEITSAIHGNDRLSTTEEHLEQPASASASGPTAIQPIDDAGAQDEEESSEDKSHYGWRFWAIFPALCTVAFLGALEATIVTTAMPTIVRDLDLGENYVWVINAFFLTSAAVQPLCGQLANIFGRRWVMLSAVAIFTLGSGVSGGATTGNMLIAGRAVQGIGSGGMIMMLDTIVSDLVPLRKRGAFMGIIFAAVNVGTALGPFVGGIIVQTISWRWSFYLNLPIGGTSLLVLFAVLHTNYENGGRLVGRLKRIDYVGNAILMASTVSILFALTYGGAKYAWSSWRILMPLVLGLLGMTLFMVYEGSKFCVEPVVPLRLFGNRTSAAAYMLAFMWSILSMWRIYFLSVYFQGVLGSSPSRAGVQLLPSVMVLLPAVVISGAIVKKTGKYLPLHYIGFGGLVLGQGMLTILDPHSSTGVWVVLQLIVGFFSALVLTTLLPAIQADLAESDVGAATATWAFVRSFGIVWGVTIPAAIFNNRFDQLAYRITDPATQALLTNGQAYGHASKEFLDTLGDVLRRQVVEVYSDSLKRAWQVAIVFAGVAFLVVFAEKHITLRTQLDTKYGLKDQKKDKSGESGLKQNEKPPEPVDEVKANSE